MIRNQNPFLIAFGPSNSEFARNQPKVRHRREKSNQTYPTGRGMEMGPEKSPAPETFRFKPNRILHSVKNDTVQNGRRKSW